jgi:hypothetical protein
MLVLLLSGVKANDFALRDLFRSSIRRYPGDTPGYLRKIHGKAVTPDAPLVPSLLLEPASIS